MHEFKSTDACYCGAKASRAYNNDPHKYIENLIRNTRTENTDCSLGPRNCRITSGFVGEYAAPETSPTARSEHDVAVVLRRLSAVLRLFSGKDLHRSNKKRAEILRIYAFVGITSVAACETSICSPPW